MAVVIGNRIVNLPRNNLENLLGGVGDILNAIGTQRQETKDRQQITDLDRILQGDVLPADQAGPTRPGITDPQERLNAILATSLKVRNPQTANRLLNAANIQERAIPTATTRSPDRRNFTITNKAGRKQRISATDAEALQIENSLPGGSVIELGTTEKQTGVTDLVQKAIRTNPDGSESEVNARLIDIDADPSLRLVQSEKNPRRVVKVVDPDTQQITFVDKVEAEARGTTFPLDTATTPSVDQQQSSGDISSQLISIRDQIAETGGNITTDELLLSRGPLSGIRQGFANIIGGFLRGEQAADTASARQQVAQLGFTLTTIIGNNKRFPEGERKAIQKITTRSNAFFADAPGALRDIRNFRANGEAKNIADRNTLNTKRVSGQKRRDLFDNIATRESVFLILPTLQELDFALEPIKNRDLTQLSRQDINFISTHPEVVDSLNERQKQQVAQRAQELGFTPER